MGASHWINEAENTLRNKPDDSQKIIELLVKAVRELERELRRVKHQSS